MMISLKKAARSLRVAWCFATNLGAVNPRIEGAISYYPVFAASLVAAALR
jgi:hypothetical protein